MSSGDSSLETHVADKETEEKEIVPYHDIWDYFGRDFLIADETK